MSISHNLLRNWYYMLGILFGLDLYFTGVFRIQTAISLGIKDELTRHYGSVGVLYVQLAPILIIFLTIGLTYSLVKNKGRS